MKVVVVGTGPERDDVVQRPRKVFFEVGYIGATKWDKGGGGAYRNRCVRRWLGKA
jgi:hypothetical protein